MYVCNMAVSILYASITFVQITLQVHFFIAPAFRNTHPGHLSAWLMWAPLGPCEPGPCGFPLGLCEPGTCGLHWALEGQAFVRPQGPLWAAPLWAPLGP